MVFHLILNPAVEPRMRQPEKLRDVAAQRRSGGGADLLLQRLAYKLEQRLRRRIVRQAEILVKLAVVGFLGREALGRNARVLQHGLEALRLRARVGMVGDMENEKRRDAFALR